MRKCAIDRNLWPQLKRKGATQFLGDLMFQGRLNGKLVKVLDPTVHGDVNALPEVVLDTV
jgi:hypothetical protein